jgi:malate dehydrogenase (oxaloacetate-decarboxylating)(NADP+)
LDWEIAARWHPSQSWKAKEVLFKKFADIDVYDIEVDTHDPQLMIEVVASIAPTFGGI